MLNGRTTVMLETARMVRIHLFGRPQLTEGEQPLPFKAPARAVSLLAYLLVHGAVPLKRDAVAFALWPDDLESDARANLRRHMFYLTNDVLPPPPKSPWILADKRTIAWNAAAPAWCDVREYEPLSLDSSSAAQAVTLYRGDLLEGFEDEWLQAPRERLRERQLDLLLGLIGASRAARAHAAGIAYARQLLAIDPWREDGIRALIELRHLTGDRAGALATYRDFVKRLEAEMGVAPMPETAAIYERVAAATLATSVELESVEPVARQGSGPAFVPSPHWHAPASIGNAEAIRPVPSFTGREDELARLDTALWEQTGQAAVHGLGGVGKSALAREYARRNRERYAAVWWLNAETEAGIIDGLVRLGSEFVPALAKREDRRSAAEDVTANVLSGLTKPVLLVFDNLDDERLLRAWAPRSAAHIVATSRNAAFSGDIVAIGLPTWEPQETIHYLRREIGRADLSDDDALLLAQSLGFLPLALAHAAAYLKGTVNVTASRYLERINDHLARTPRGADYNRAVYATFREAIVRAEQQAPGAAALLCLAACFAADAIPEELFRQKIDAYAPLVPDLGSPVVSPRHARASVADELDMEDALGALHQFSMLTFSPRTRTYTMHRLVQAAARRILADGNVAWVQTAVTVAHAAFPESEFAQWPHCERLVAHARAALDWLSDADCPEAAAALALRCGEYLRKRAAFSEAEPLLRRGLKIAEGLYGADTRSRVADHGEALAALLRDSNRMAEAEPLHRRSIEVYEQTLGPEHPRLAAALNDLAILLQYANQFSEAEALFRRALSIDERGYGSDDPIVALRLHNLALVLHETNRRNEAEALLRRALQIDERTHDAAHPDIANDVGNLGWLLFDCGRIDEAEPLLRRTVAISQAAYGHQHPNYAHALSDLGVLAFDAGRVPEAERLHAQALAIYEATYGAAHPVVAAGLNNVAEVLAATGHEDEAESHYRCALASDEVTYGRSHANVARDLNNLAGLLLATARAAEAAAAMLRARAIVTATYAADHPRVQCIAANIDILEGMGISTGRAGAPATRWRSIRRSPSRGLR